MSRIDPQILNAFLGGTGRRTSGWEAGPGPAVTGTPAEPGEVRADTNGTQWHLTPAGWQPVIIPVSCRTLEPVTEPEAS